MTAEANVITPAHTQPVEIWGGGGFGRRRLVITCLSAASYTVYQPREPTAIQSLADTDKLVPSMAMATTQYPDVLDVNAALQVIVRSSVASAFTFRLEN